MQKTLAAFVLVNTNNITKINVAEYYNIKININNHLTI